MKNKKILLAVLAIALVFGMTACDNGSTGGSKKKETPSPKTPVLTDLIVLLDSDALDQNWEPKTTFTTADSLACAGKLDNPDKNFKQIMGSMKKDGADLGGEQTWNAPSNINDYTQYTYYMGLGSLSAPQFGVGSYEISVYIIDTAGKKSNVKTVSFTVSAP
jgi:hypothetical protein